MSSTTNIATARALALAVGVATAVVLTGCTGTPAVKPTTAIPTGIVKGVMTVTDSGNIRASSQGLMPCSIMSSSGYSDFATGTEVDAVDASGTVLAFGDLQPGSTPGTKALGESCAFAFTIRGVPRGEKIYGLQIGRRGTTHYAEKDFFGHTLEPSIGG